MRLRTHAAVFAGALSLVLPSAGPSLADDHADQGGRGIGTLHYRFLDEGGRERREAIRPAGNDTCYVLTGTSRDEPAVEVTNNTESLAVLFDNRGCNGEAVVVLKPGERARRVEVVGVFFKPADEHDGRHDGNGGGGNGGDGDGGRGDEGRGDQGREEQGREDQGGGDWDGGGGQGQGQGQGEDVFDAVFRIIG